MFVVINDDNDVGSNLFILPKNQNGYKIISFWDLVNAEYIERNNKEEIRECMRNIS